MNEKDTLSVVLKEYSLMGQSEEAIANMTGIRSVEDVYYWQTNDTLYLQFGKFIIPLNKEALLTTEITTSLKKLNVTIKKYKNIVLIYYKGERIREVQK